jgi:hypothetical protein
LSAALRGDRQAARVSEVMKQLVEKKFDFSPDKHFYRGEPE